MTYSRPHPAGWRCLRALFCLLPSAICLLPAAFCLGCSGCGQTAPTATTPPGAPVIRVRLLAGIGQIKLTAKQQPIIRVGGGTAQRLNVPAGATVAVALKNNAWQIGSLKLGAGELYIEPQPEGSVKVDGRAYRGSFRLVPIAPSAFDVVNDVHVESYLRGVLAREMLPEFEPGAYNAQAVVARAYALYEARTAPKGRGWDVFADTKSQVYGGIADETAKAVAATEATTGQVVVWGEPGAERIFKAYFSSCCGGAGQSAADAFGDLPSAPLSEQAFGARCAASPRFKWGPVIVTKDELTRRFRAFGKSRGRAEKDIARIEKIDVFRVNPVHRPTQFIVTDIRGQRYLLSGEELRWAVNTDAPDAASTLSSSFVSPVADRIAIRFENGHGFGHGVGLCQWCAQVQAKQGVPYETIVTGAYKGSKVVRAY